MESTQCLASMPWRPELEVPAQRLLAAALAAGIDIDQSAETGDSPLHDAAAYHCEFGRHLIEAGADVK